MNAPKISVIIPLYNAEKYIRKCLISVLASKFKDYEVLVVDDCSTDNSVAEVEKISPYFDGRLKIFSTEKNSGGPGVPRNIGIKNSSSKYVTFIDNDDLILPDDLRIFFELAETYGADVVHTEKHFFCFNEFTGDNLHIRYAGVEEKMVNAPTFEPAALDHRMYHFIYEDFCIVPWSKLYRRDFLLANEIFFPPTQYGEDFVFCFKCLCLAEKYLLVPHITNLHRVLTSSASRINLSLEDSVNLWLKTLFIKLAALDEFMGKLEFFNAQPDCRRDVLKYCTDMDFGIIKDFLRPVPPHKLQEVFFDALQNPELDATGKNIFTAHLCAEKFSTR